MGVRPETHAESPHFQSRALSVCKPNVAATIPKGILKDHGVDRALVCKVDPIVRTVQRTVHHVLRISKGEARENLPAYVGLSISIRVFENPDIWSGGD